jgi:transposase InsO family protein
VTEAQAQELADYYLLEADLMAELTGVAGYSQRAALELVGLSRASWHYRSSPRPPVAQVVPHAQRRAPGWLTGQETAAIVERIAAGFAEGKSVYQAYYEALDDGAPIASLASWHRLARAHLEAQRPVRRRRKHRASAIPQLEATGCLQVWSWDITKLPGPYRGENYDFYVTLDVFSRAIVGWRVEDRESDQLAADMFRTAFDASGAVPDVVHSDGGPSMTSKTVAELFRDLGIQTSRNRPRVSNDNPYSESAFKTGKYHPSYPRYFKSLEEARAWADQFVTWYNNIHRHSSLEGHTPASVHDGTWIAVHHRRQQALDELHRAHPHRFPRRPQARTPMATVTINRPKTHHRLQTG